ncbi:MAG: SPASM domain-containing protein, partial [Pseudomonadota bacterium]
RTVDELVESGLVRRNPLVGLHMLGEPLLHPEIWKFIEYMNSRGLAADMLTNGLLLTEEVIDRLSSFCVARLTVSIQSPDESAYRQARPGSPKEWGRYMDSIRRAVERYLRMALEQPSGGIERLDLLYMTTFHYRPGMDGFSSWVDIRERLEEWRVLAAGICPDSCMRHQVGCDADNIQKFRICTVGARTLNFSIREAGSWAGTLDHARKPEPVNEGRCSAPCDQLIVLANGDVTLCCEDYDGKLAIGNVRENDLARIWMSEKARAIRNGFSENRVVDPYCQNCLGYRLNGSVDPVEDGFFPLERGGNDGPFFQWMGNRASMIVSTAEGDSRLVIRVLTINPCSQDSPQTFEVRLEQCAPVLFLLTRPHDWHTFELDLPAPYMSRFLLVSFETDRYLVPSQAGISADRRRLGAAVALPCYQQS